jgi:hypothetical protein
MSRPPREVNEMKVGVHVVNFTLPGGAAAIGPTLAEIGRAAEDAGVANLSVMDHYLQLGGQMGTAGDPMLEGDTTLGFLAAKTSTPTCMCSSRVSPTGTSGC